MEVSKLTIRPELLLTKKLNQKQKKSFRKKLIKEYIQDKPYGTPISINEFSRLCHYTGENAAYKILDEMISCGEISREKSEGKTFSYTVNGQVHVTKFGLSNEEVKNKAMQFAWENDSDSLREFIKWISK